MTLRPNSVSGIMLTVVLALLPGTVLHAWQFGPVVWLQAGWCILLALLMETLCLHLRREDIRHGLGDMSWLVCGCLMARALPLLSPLWLIALATLVALGLVKHGSGGLGKNRLNPVMAGLGVVAVCFYQLQYPAPGFQAPWTLQLDIPTILQQQLQLVPRLQLDALSSATPLAHERLDAPAPLLSWSGYLAGGLLLALLRVSRLEIPLAMMCSSVLLCMAAGHNLQESLHSLTLGGYMFAAFFIATDPVTSPDCKVGRILFGLTIGVITELVREFGLYADGLCFAVLAANMLVPQLNQLARKFNPPGQGWQPTRE
ncbi:RnfABCDGE type electron transport complex subunit D [Vogesella sp. GCM10023246]|uniref:RnfABCDGE type electron transport complex subunit D n=1 Tax=Vogesella oryzagri TaxID=3160864 RepID=A0ABV1M7Q8_9NEIS